MAAAQVEWHGRQVHAHCAGGGEQGQFGGGRHIQVVGRDGAQLHGQADAPQRLEFVGVDLGRQPQGQASLQHPPGLGAIKDVGLAKHIAEEGPAAPGKGRPRVPGRRGGQHLVDHQVDVLVGPAPVLGRDGVGPHKGGHQIDGVGAVQGGDGPEHLELARGVEPVAGLDLDGGRAQGQHGVQAGAGLALQLVHGGLAHGAHRAGDAAAGGHDLHVAGPPDPQLELVHPVAGIKDVGVGIDKAGADDAAAGVDGLAAGIAGSQFVGGSGGHDRAAVDGHRPIGQGTHIGHGAGPLGAAGAGAGDQLGGAVDQQIDVHGMSGARSRSSGTAIRTASLIWPEVTRSRTASM